MNVFVLTIRQPWSWWKCIIIMQQNRGSGGINLSGGVQIQTLINQLIWIIKLLQSGYSFRVRTENILCMKSNSEQCAWMSCINSCKSGSHLDEWHPSLWRRTILYRWWVHRKSWIITEKPFNRLSQVHRNFLLILNVLCPCQLESNASFIPIPED